MFEYIPDIIFIGIVKEYAFYAGQIILTKEDLAASIYNYCIYVKNNN